MSKCQAGDCEVECAGRGCGCIAESDNPSACICICSGGDTRAGFALEATTLVDVQTDELPLFEVASLFNAVFAKKISVPAHRLREPVSINLKRVPFGDVLSQVGLDTRDEMQEGKRIALLAFLGGLAAGALLFALLSEREER